ncbi:MAG: cyanophycinase [Bacteroidetes bacterium]|nr:cyanophycinase [Bacteroidota bacterium]HET6243386.1 cyanophycinase [Bacteroidia bacterium]
MLHKEITKEVCPIPKGILLAIGGAENKGDSPELGSFQEKLQDPERLSILKLFANELIKKEQKKIEIITTASSEPKILIKEYKEAFKKLGFEVGHIHHYTRKEAMENKFIERIEKADGVLFSGGNQLKLTSHYGGTDILNLLKEKYIYSDFVIAGTSAGAMALSTPLIYYGSKETGLLKGAVNICIGLEFIKNVAIDTHFGQRGRFVRMVQVIVTNPTCIGIGIEEDTAIIIRNGKDIEVCGNGIVVIADGHSCHHINIADIGQDEAIEVNDLKVHLLTKKSKYSIPIDL